MVAGKRRRSSPRASAGGRVVDSSDLRKRQRQRADDTVNFCHARYEHTKNPVFVWEALGAALRLGLPVAPWVAGYLQHVAAQMSQLSRTRIPDEPSRAVYEALGFPVGAGAVNPFRFQSDDAHDLSIGLEVYFKMREKYQEYLAVEEVAAEHPSTCERTPPCKSISPATVRRHFKRHGLPLWSAFQKE